MNLDYGQLLRRAWDIIWNNKFLIVLGLLVALTSGGNIPGTGLMTGRRDSHYDRPMPRDFGDLPEMPEFRSIPRDWGVPIAAGGALLLVIVGVAITVGLIFWVVATLARGGLIAGTDAVADGGTSSFAESFAAGWRKGWRLILIGIVPAIPGMALLLGGLGIAGFTLGLTQFIGVRGFPLASGVLLVLGPVMCIAVPVGLVLGLLRTFAERACMLEDLGVFAAYKRGWRVLIGNIGPAIILFAIQVGIGVALGLTMALPGVLMALCCILWPVLLAIRGTVASYFSTLWTLAWHEWTLQGENA
jgi:hypothetical protein